jgi:hypothetical protein
MNANWIGTTPANWLIVQHELLVRGRNVEAHKALCALSVAQVFWAQETSAVRRLLLQVWSEPRAATVEDCVSGCDEELVRFCFDLYFNPKA